MNDIRAVALARLRTADPAGAPPDPRGPYAHAMLERILAATDAPAPARARPVRRWIAVGSVGAAATAASVLAVTTPWSHGQAASAYTVDRLPNGSLNVTIQLGQLRDAARLNAELNRENAHTVVLQMLSANQCSIPPSIVDQFAEPGPNSPEKAAIQQAVTWDLRTERAALVIHPQQIPVNETLVVAYAVYQPPNGRGAWIMVRIVPSVPRCLPAPPPPSEPTGDTPRR